jgi:N-acetylated-alpha-linked acidic dipeptidase
MRFALGLLLFLLSAPSGAPAGSERLRGFAPERSAWQRDYERRLAELPSPAECDALLRQLTREPHVAGTPGNERVAQFIAEEFRKAGLEVSTPKYDVLLSYPKSARLEIVGEPGVPLARTEEPVPSDPDTAVAKDLPPWNAYAPSADITAEVVYVNRGSAEDYDRLASMGVDVRGKIVLARYFGGYRGGKSLEGEKRGVAGILVFSDPIDDGWYRGEVYPPGPWGPASHFQRGATVYDFLVPGDPLTPGWASTAGARRIPESESAILPKIPMMPLSARDAAEILKRLRGRAVPDGWQGLAVADTYRIGPGPARVHLAIENTRERRTITNVIGVLRGTDEPERKILLSNHHDAWVYGAVDPCSGTATMISLARALGTLARQGLRPRRTIVFGDWDAEEYTLTGSTEWGEENEADLAKNAIVCVNVDASTSGRNFSASASPLAFEVIRDTAADVADPGAPGKSVADAWRENSGRTNVRSYATGASREEALPIAILGSGSDYTVFFNRLGIPSIDLVFDGPYGVYHSVYDDYTWMATAGDPGFLYHAAMARYAGSLALRFANADVLPFEAAAYGREIARYAEELAGEPGAAALRGDLAELARAARIWSAASEAAQKQIEARLAAGGATVAENAAANAWLLSLERSLLDPAGLPGRPWFRHLIYAPLPSYAAETLPAIREASVAGNLETARSGLANLQNRLASAASSARTAAGGVAPASGSAVFLGTITDAECGADHRPMIRKGGMGANAAECTLACAAKGTPFGFIDARSRKFFQLDDAEKPRLFAGRTVRVTGRVEGDTIRVDSIEAAQGASKEGPMDATGMKDFGTRYAAAWSSRDPARLASFYEPNGSLKVNDGAASVGRAAITETAKGFMTAFPDMVVKMDELVRQEDEYVFRWTWTGTNTGPGGTGKAVRIRGYEEWTIGPDGLIAQSLGHFDEAEYRRQLGTGVAGTP